MREIRLSDETFERAEKSARELGFEGVEAYIDSLVNEDQVEFDEGAFFTSERVAQIDEALEDIKQGRVHTPEQVSDYLAKLRADRLKDKAV